MRRPARVPRRARSRAAPRHRCWRDRRLRAASGCHSSPQRAQRTARRPASIASGTSYSAWQEGQAMRIGRFSPMRGGSWQCRGSNGGRWRHRAEMWQRFPAIGVRCCHGASGAGRAALREADAGPEVLRDLTFTIPEGGFRWLLGPSGAGKTSLLRLLYLAVRPTRAGCWCSAPISAARTGARCRRCAAGSAWCSRISACCRICRRSTTWRCRCASPAGRRGRSAPMSARCCAGSGSRASRRRAPGGALRRRAAARGDRARRGRRAPACCSPTSRPATWTTCRPSG